MNKVTKMICLAVILTLLIGCRQVPTMNGSISESSAGLSENSVENSQSEISISSSQDSAPDSSDATSGNPSTAYSSSAASSSSRQSSTVSSNPGSSSSSSLSSSSASQSTGTEPDWPIDNSIRPLGERLGVTYWGSKYVTDYNTTKSGMKSAINQWNKLGTKVVKLSTNQLLFVYPFDKWDNAKMNSLDDILAQEPFKLVFAQNYKTHLIVAIEAAPIAWTDGVSKSEGEYVTDQFYKASKYLFKTYKGTGKTFILQNWEGDNMLGYTDGGAVAVKAITDYFNARQAGIKKAQDEFGMGDDVYVFGAIEVNLLLLTRDMPKLLDEVVPYTNADLYFYSCYEKKDKWDIGDNGKENNVEAIKNWILVALTKLSAKAPDSKYFGSKNIAISEFGYPEILGQVNHPEISGEDWQHTVARATVEAGVAWGVQYMVYWELYCNEFMNGKVIYDWTKITNADMSGYWLVRPDGTENQTFRYFQTIIAANSVK